MESTNSSILIVALVAIVSIVGMTVFIGNSGSSYVSSASYAASNVGGNAMSTGGVCGNGIIEREECDSGRKNGIACVAGYNQQCTYCTTKCLPRTVVGPRCGDSVCSNAETCSTCGVDCGACAVEVSSCTEITAPGNYVLSADIRASSEKCVYIHDTSNVIFDCQGHSIDLNNYGFIAGGIEIDSVNDFALKNCFIERSNILPLQITNSARGAITNTVVGVYASTQNVIGVYDSSNILFSTNRLHAIQIRNSNHVTVKNNVLNVTSTPGNVAGVISTSNGFNNAFIGNTIDGGSDGVFRNLAESIGADDGIVLSNERNVLVDGNILTNFWDCGIEGSGFLRDSKISNNFISNAPICGIGAWYWLSWKNNLVENNVANNTGPLFIFFRQFNLLPSEDKAYFTDNIFKNNRDLLRSTVAMNICGGASGCFVFYALDGNSSPVYSIPFEVKNNLLIGNDFGKLREPPIMRPVEGFIDGGGNICGPIVFPYPPSYTFFNCGEPSISPVKSSKPVY